MKFSKEIPMVIVASACTTAIIAAILLLAGVAHADRTSVSSGSGIMVVTACNTASSTLAYIQTPFTGATSTVIFTEFTGVNSATTSDIVIATSTSQYAPASSATSTLAENVMGLASIAANAAIYSIAGQLMGPGGYYNPAATPATPYKTNTMTVVGPNQGLLAYSTSTAAAGGYAIPKSCSIETIWVQ